MRLLFDENIPFTLARELIGHECSHVIRLGWSGARNGALPDREEQAGFDALVTLDDDRKLEQKMTDRKIAVVVIKPPGQGKAPMKAMTGRVLISLTSIKPGKSVRLGPSDEA